MVPLFNDYLMIINTDIDSPYQTYTLAAVKVFFLARRFLLSFFPSFSKPANTSEKQLLRSAIRSFVMIAAAVFIISTHTHTPRRLGYCRLGYLVLGQSLACDRKLKKEEE